MFAKTKNLERTNTRITANDASRLIALPRISTKAMEQKNLVKNTDLAGTTDSTTALHTPARIGSA